VLSGGLRLALVVAAPLLGAMLVHELRGRRVAGLATALAAITACAALAASVAGGVTGGGSVEHTFGGAIPGVEFTTRADSASVAAVLLACLAALLAVARRRDERDHACGMLLCLAGCAAVAMAGNLVIAVAGVEVIAGGALLAGGRSGAGTRSSRLLVGAIGGAGLALVAAAAQLVAGAGSSDLAAVSPTVIGGAVAVPWAICGATLVLCAALPVRRGSGAGWAAVGALPAGFLLLLRLQQSTGGQLPGIASTTLAVAGGAAGLVAAVAALRARTLAAAGRAAVAVVASVLVSLFGGPLQGSGVLVAGLFVALVVALLAAPAWAERPTAWSLVSVAALALPGGTAIAATVVGLGAVVHRGTGGFPQLLVLCVALAAAAVAAARRLAVSPGQWRPVQPGAVIAVAAGVVGGLVPGLAMSHVAVALAGGATSVDLDAGAIQVPGAGFAGGYITLAAVILVVAAASAALLVAGEPVGAPVASVQPTPMPSLALMLAARRATLPGTRRLSAALEGVDHWLEAQPRLPLFLGAAALAVLLFR
jgi:hypothetical protein